MRYIFNVWSKIVEDLNAHIVYSPLVYSKLKCIYVRKFNDVMKQEGSLNTW